MKTHTQTNEASAPADKSAQLVRLCEALAACRAVVDNWEHGDLAAAARMCQAVIARAGKSGAHRELRQALARAKRALDGDSNDEEHDALYELVETLDEAGAPSGDTLRDAVQSFLEEWQIYIDDEDAELPDVSGLERALK